MSTEITITALDSRKYAKGDGVLVDTYLRKCLRNSKLSFEARGFYMMLLTMPEGVAMTLLRQERNGKGRYVTEEEILKYVQDLTDAGYPIAVTPNKP